MVLNNNFVSAPTTIFSPQYQDPVGECVRSHAEPLINNLPLPEFLFQLVEIVKLVNFTRYLGGKLQVGVDYQVTDCPQKLILVKMFYHLELNGMIFVIFSFWFPWHQQ
jgi:hypothetical protein